MFHTRLAPTPSGYLHIGNIYSFVYTWLIARQNSGSVRLRIDDFDSARTKDIYIDDIFQTLAWLGLDFDTGPSGTSDFISNYSQKLRQELYADVLKQISNNDGAVFYCNCSRQQINAVSPDGQYTGTCYNKISYRKNAAIRLRTKKGSNIVVPDMIGQSHTIDLYEQIRDCVIWRKDDLPAYQLVSLADDVLYGTNLVVRGADLLASSAIQLFMSTFLKDNSFQNVAFVHHELISHGNLKLSKSQMANPVREQFSTPKHVYIYIGKLLGLPTKKSESLSLLLEHFKPNFNEDQKTKEL